MLRRRNSLLRLILDVYKEHKGLFIALVVLGLFLSLIPFLNRFAEGRVIDELVRIIDGNLGVTSTLTGFIVIVIALTALDTTLWILHSYLNKIHYFNLGKLFTFKFLDKAYKLNHSAYENPKISKIIYKASETYDWKPRETAGRLIWLFIEIGTLVSSLIVVLNFSIVAFVVVVVTAIPTIIFNTKYGKEAWGIWDASSDERKMYWGLKDYISSEKAIKEIRIYNAGNYLFNRVKNIFTGFAEKERKAHAKKAAIESLTGNISKLGILVFWVIAIFAAVEGEISIGLLTFYIASITAFSGALNWLFRIISDVREDMRYLDDYYAFIDLEESIKEGAVELPINSQGLSIEFKNVSFKYPDTELYVLKDFNLKVEAGEKIALVGENGAGKSTLIKLLVRFYDPEEGEILINGRNIKDLSFESLFQSMGILFQDFVRYDLLTFKENVLLGNIQKEFVQNEFEEIIAKSRANSVLQKLSNGENQILEPSFEGGVDLSGGQWQRIALARSFYKDSPILVLDEPTSAIDAKAEEEIFETLFDFAKEKTVIIISHRFSTVRKANKIIVLVDGKITESGTHQELVNLNGTYAESFNAQAKGYV